MLIIVAKAYDFFSDCVIRWLMSLGLSEILLINDNDTLRIEKINLGEQKILLSVNGKEVDFDKISFFWYRGGMLPIPKHDWKTNDKHISRQVKRFVNYEWRVLQDYLFYILQQKKHIGNYFTAETNKLRNLRIAEECGLMIPQTIIAQDGLAAKLNSDDTYIVKPIGESIPFTVNEGAYRLYTREIENNYLENNKQTYFPSLLQNKVDIDFEIRVFAFAEYSEFYAMAIFMCNLMSMQITENHPKRTDMHPTYYRKISRRSCCYLWKKRDWILHLLIWLKPKAKNMFFWKSTLLAI